MPLTTLFDHLQKGRKVLGNIGLSSERAKSPVQSVRRPDDVLGDKIVVVHAKSIEVRIEATHVQSPR